MKTQTNETITQNAEAQRVVHTISNEQAEKQNQEYWHEKRVKYVRRYLAERAKRNPK